MADPGRGFPREGRPQVARGRSRGIQPPKERKSGSPGAVASQMESLELGLPSVSRGGRSSGSGSPTEGRYEEGGNGNGGNGGNGGGNGGSPPGQRGTPRGRQRGDYVESRPKDLATKKGTSGEQIRLVANYFELQRKKQQDKTWRLYKYRVEYQPEVDHKGKRKGLLRSVQADIGANTFDGQNLYVSLLLPDKVQHLVTKDREGNDYVLSCKLVEELQPSDPMYLSFYNILMKKCQSKLKMTEMGRNYFDDQQAIRIEQWGLELWPGFITVMQQHENSVMLCVEVTHKVLRLDNVLNVMSQIRNSHRGASQDVIHNAVASELVGTIVMTEYNKRTYRVDDIMWGSTPEDTFLYKGNQVKFADYFKEKYGVVVKSLKQPLLASKPKKRDVHRGITEPFLLIPELCRMTGLNDTMRKDFTLMKSLSEYLLMVPDRRLKSVCGFVNRIMGNEEIRQELLTWGLRFKSEPAEIPGRVLPKQQINFGGQPPKQPELPDQKADWTMAFRSRTMLSTINLTCWAMIVTERDAQGLDALAKAMNQVGRPLNFNISPPEVVRINQPSPQSFTQAIQRTMDRMRGIMMVFVILPTNRLDTYAAVKQQTYVNYGIPSQCFLSKNVRSKGLMSIATKCVVQMNAKLGGEPWSVSVPLSNMMVVGFDVYHASTDGRRGQAVGAIVASTSRHLTQYFSAVSYHSDNEELSANLLVDFQKCLMAYRGINSKLPDRIMFYRDGVGQGQLSLVFEQELTRLRECIATAYQADGRAPPTLTFVVCSKRINTRIFEKKGPARGDNPPPGTVVDDVITLPERYDFFIVAQSVRQGTVSPTSYNVLSDNSGLGADKIQLLTYKMCHMYYNWSGTVAVPSPVQYAHKLAFLTGTALGDSAHGNLSNLLYFL